MFVERDYEAFKHAVSTNQMWTTRAAPCRVDLLEHRLEGGAARPRGGRRGAVPPSEQPLADGTPRRGVVWW